MITIERILIDAERNGEAINPMFEERLAGLVSILHRIAAPLSESGIEYELIGGLAVFVHVEEADPEHAMLTRDVDIMVHRADLDTIIGLAARHGFRFRHVSGVDMLTFGDTDSAKNAVHLVFSGELVRPTHVTPTPPINPVIKSIYGEEIHVVSVPDLLRMKLNAFRLKDRVHIQVMDAAGLISPGVESTLPFDLRERLREVRETE